MMNDQNIHIKVRNRPHLVCLVDLGEITSSGRCTLMHRLYLLVEFGENNLKMQGILYNKEQNKVLLL